MKIVIIGGVAAGAKAAAKSKREKPDSEIHIYTQEQFVSYSACGLPYYIQGNFEDWRKLLIRSVEEFEKSGINIHLLHKVTRILHQDKKIAITNLETNETFLETYDKLVIATGTTPILPQIKNVELENIFTLKTLHDGIAIKEQMAKSQNITIVGAGYIAIELLEGFIKNGKNVTLIEKAPYILPAFDEEMSTQIQNYVLENSNGLCRIITNDTVSEFIGVDSVKGVLTENGIGFITDMVIVSIGVRPNIELAQSAGIEIGKTGAIKVNSRMETNIQDIYACGDCVEKINMISNTPTWLPLGSTANKEGRVAAVNLCGGNEDFEGILGSSVVRFLGLNLSMSGLSEKVAKNLDFDTVSVMITKKDKASYMPDVENVTLRLVADRRTHKLLGIQAIGSQDADKKVNIVSAGLRQRMTVEDLAGVDLTYSPPFSTSIDILHSAARMLESKLRG